MQNAQQSSECNITKRVVTITFLVFFDYNFLFHFLFIGGDVNFSNYFYSSVTKKDNCVLDYPMLQNLPRCPAVNIEFHSVSYYVKNDKGKGWCHLPLSFLAI